MKHQAERIEEAKNGKADPEKLQKAFDEATEGAKQTVESEGGKMMRTGAEELLNFFKEDVQLGVVDGKGGQAQTDKARDGSANEGRISTNGDSSGSNRHEDKFKTDFTRKETTDDAAPTSKITTENLTLNRNNEGNTNDFNKPDKPETTGSSTGGNNVTGINGSSFFSNNSTGGSNTTFANVQGNAFGYGPVEASRTEGVNVGTGNVVTTSNNTETFRNKAKETTASNIDEPKTPKVKTNNFTIGKNNNKEE